MNRSPIARMLVVLGAIAPLVCGSGVAPMPDDAIETFKQQAKSLQPLITTPAGRELLAAVDRLPAIEPRTIWIRRGTRNAITDAQYQALPTAEREAFDALEVTTQRYYETFYGSPLASLRALDIAAGRGEFASYRGKRILDIGYGSIGQLRLLALCGAHAVGVDIDERLAATYAATDDQGQVNTADGASGSVTLIRGLWPAEVGDQVRAASGGGVGFDLIISKNTLKKGYVTPDEPSERGRGVDLSVSPQDYVQALADALAPGGLTLIYNMGPAPGPAGRGVDDQGDPTYVHMADTRCPFEAHMWEAAGLEVIVFNEPDSDMIRRFGACFDWDDPLIMGRGVMNLPTDLFATYTLVRKPTPDSARR